MSSLSDRQRRILGFIMDFTETHDYPPTIREIGEQVGITSTSVVNYNLAKLEEMKLLTRQREVSRGLSLNRSKLADLGIVGENARGVGNGANGASSSNGALTLDTRRRIDDEIPTARRVRVPILGKIAAGNPIQVEAIDPAAAEDWIELAEGLLGANQPLFALRVQGDSMIDASVLDGDIVILRHQTTADDGDMVAAWIDGDEETTLKYLFRQGRDVRLQPANPNPEYKPIVRPAEKVRINGKVVSVIRLLH
jgi:repressor LexA